MTFLLDTTVISGLRRRDRADPAVLSWADRQSEGRIVAIDAAVALKCAGLHVPNPRSDRDACVAATALVHNLTVVTRNTRDFAGAGVGLFNPWTTQS